MEVLLNGMREPRWHPVTAEMGYVARGHARMRVLDPDGALDEYVLSPGDAYFVPRAYPHHIEDIGDGDINFLIFFDQPTPGDVGYRDRVLPRGPGRRLRPARARPPAIPVHPCRPADRRTMQPGRPGRLSRAPSAADAVRGARVVITMLPTADNT